MRGRSRDDSQDGWGSPDLRLAGFQLWVHGRQFEGSDDFWDGNWLRVTAHCAAEGASVRASGALVRVPELQSWAGECEDMLAFRYPGASLHCIEPNLAIEMRMDRQREAVTLEVRITPDQATQEHCFTFSLDPSSLSDFLRDLHGILDRYPVRGSEEG
jgi:hypothetical protein